MPKFDQNNLAQTNHPFGYCPDRADPGSLLIHVEEAKTLCHMYAAVLAASGHGADAADSIARDLDAAEIPVPSIDGRASETGWTRDILCHFVANTRHVGMIVIDCHDGDGTDTDALSRRPNRRIEAVPHQAIIRRDVYDAANRILGTDGWAEIRELIEAVQPGASPKEVVTSSTALVAATPAPVSSDDVDDEGYDEDFEALIEKPTVPALRVAQRQPFDRDRKSFRVLGVDALPAASRRKLAPSTDTRSSLRRRAFFYTRFSTDLQEVKSEDRQLVEIADYAMRNHYDEEARFGDRGKSGTAMLNRPGLQEMMRRVRTEKPTAVVVEDLDRLSRRLPDLLSMYYELKMLGTELHDVKLGKLDLIHIVMRGYMAEEGRVRFLEMSRKGKEQALRDGKVISKGAYGYRLDLEMKGVHVIDIEAARVVRWIFKVVAKGMSAGACARELTRKGIYPPAQWREVVRGNAVAQRRPWHATTILKILHNHVYLGYVTLNREVRIVDVGSGKTKGYELGDEKDWVVVQHDDLAIVDEDTWARAAIRLADYVYKGESSNLRFLLTGRAKCTCGAYLKAYNTEGATYYQCTSRLLASGCKIKDHHRIDWLETVVVEKVLNSGFGADNVENYVSTTEAEIRSILKDDVERAAVIRRRLAKIDDLQQASFERHPRTPPRRIVKIRQKLELEADELEIELGDLHNPASFLGVLHAMRSVHGDLSRVLAEIPFRPTDPEGIAMANILRDAIAEVIVHPGDDTGRTRVVIVIDFLARLRDEIGAADTGRLVLETGFDAYELRKVERDACYDRNGQAMAAAAEDGRYDLSDAEWALLEPLTERIDLETGGAIAGRTLLDGMVCLGRAGGPPHRIPQRYGDKDIYRRAAKRFVYAGMWDLAKKRLSEAGCIWINEPGFARFDTLDFPRRNAGARPESTKAARDRAELLKLAEAEPEGDPVRIRMEYVAELLSPDNVMGIGELARHLGMSAASGYHHWDKYKARGIAVLVRREGQFKATYLDAEKVDVLRKIATAGVDPDDPVEFITYPILCRICEDRFGIEYSRGGMIQLARREGFLLRPLVAAERRRRNKAAGLPALPPVAPRRLPPSASRNLVRPSSKKGRREAKRLRDDGST